MAILIEKNVPVPARSLNGKYPFSGMAVGDSFFVPGKKTIATVSAQKAYSMKFKVRKENGGVRVWRVS